MKTLDIGDGINYKHATFMYVGLYQSYNFN